MLMTSIPSAVLFAVAKSIAAMTSLVNPAPVASSTLRPIRRAAVAAPTYLPLLAAPLPATSPATCVPWP
jgi:hypothetical protein